VQEVGFNLSPREAASEQVAMEQTPSPPVNLRHALHEMAVHPVRTLVPPWSWKAAAFAAAVRGLAFFVTNLPAGREEATKALIVEAVFAFFAGGVIGASRSNYAEPNPFGPPLLLYGSACPASCSLPNREFTVSPRHRI
jgi:hypothetical protein